jgi:hypothetical protein
MGNLEGEFDSRNVKSKITRQVCSTYGLVSAVIHDVWSRSDRRKIFNEARTAQIVLKCFIPSNKTIDANRARVSQEGRYPRTFTERMTQGCPKRLRHKTLPKITLLWAQGERNVSLAQGVENGFEV